MFCRTAQACGCLPSAVVHALSTSPRGSPQARAACSCRAASHRQRHLSNRSRRNPRLELPGTLWASMIRPHLDSTILCSMQRALTQVGSLPCYSLFRARKVAKASHSGTLLSIRQPTNDGEPHEHKIETCCLLPRDHTYSKSDTGMFRQGHSANWQSITMLRVAIDDMQDSQLSTL